MGRPLDKILCEGKFYRYVVACMHNCPNPHYCREFWHFFDAVGKTPAEYYNEDGIGERAMRRVVFDCDRCGKRDVEEMFGLYNTGGEAAEFHLTPEERGQRVEKLGYATPDVPAVSYVILAELEKVRGWQHYCGKCFQAVVDAAGRILNLTPRKVGGGKKKPAPRPAPPEGEAAEPGKSAPGEGGAESSGAGKPFEESRDKAPASRKAPGREPAAPARRAPLPPDVPVSRSKGRGTQPRPVESPKPVEKTPPAEEPAPQPERRRPGRPRKVPPTNSKVLPLKS
ncbi:MAG: hypothetical protein FJ109_14615 [Deltaproteobacteria bacterium]|nr:hypothetical protein [Deltaproteobacteria bacterium]